MNIATVASADPRPDNVVRLFHELETALGARPDMLFLYCSVEYDVEEVQCLLRREAPNVPLHGGTSCMGVATQDGAFAKEGCGLGMLGISDPEGNYGVGEAVIAADPQRAAEDAVTRALIQADRPGEVPAAVWMSAPPGHEESLIAGIGGALGKDVPVAGGSSADNTVSGKWKQIANDSIHDDAVVVTVLFPSTEVMLAFHSGYEPTDAKGIITKTGGGAGANGRMLREINEKPAAVVYNEWGDGLISDKLKNGGNILSLTTLHPLGRVAGYVGDVPYYVLSHPDAVKPDGSMTLFSNIAPGDEVVFMRGTTESLISRAGRVAASALDTYSFPPEDVAGALVAYCAGCMLTVKDQLADVVASFKGALPNAPFLTAFTFGEQGCFLNGENCHGNLMISTLLFTKQTR